MASDQVKKIREKMASDPAFAAQMKAATSRDHAIRIAEAHGFGVSNLSSDGELSESDLENVAGGCGNNFTQWSN